MSVSWPRMTLVAKSLSARLLGLTLFFVMVAEVLVYVPSIAQFRRSYLEQRIASAELASLATSEQTPLPLQSVTLPVATDSTQQGPV